jgi:anti-sigma regulatory factor (Ser/Thr protein kinase)
MDLCLEEVLSNIIRHGYAGEPNHVLIIRHQTHREGFFTLVVEDEAPPFNPLLFHDPRFPPSPEDISGGGMGIHLLRQFADAVEYDPKPTGNRLIISFVSAGPSRTIP